MQIKQYSTGSISREGWIRPLYIGMFFVFGFFPPLADYLHDLVGGYEMVGNARNVWLPFAEAVLAGGDIYVAHWDNKPPLFQFINIFAAWTGHYRLAFTLLIGSANVIAALLIFEICRRNFSEAAGFIAGLFYLSGGLLFLFSKAINPRQFAVVLLLVAFLASASRSRGVAIAAAGLITQYAIFAIPALIFEDYLRGRLTVRRLLIFGLSGLATLGCVFGLIALVWSPESALKGFEYSFLAFNEYTGGYAERDLTFWTNPDKWFYRGYMYAVNLSVLAVFAFSVISDWVMGKNRIPQFGIIAIVSGAFLLLASMFRINVWYYVLPLPFFSMAAAAGLESFFKEMD